MLAPMLAPIAPSGEGSLLAGQSLASWPVLGAGSSGFLRPQKIGKMGALPLY